MAEEVNLGNVVGVLKSETPPDKTYVIWEHIVNPEQPDVVVQKIYDGDNWVPLVKDNKPWVENGKYANGVITIFHNLTLQAQVDFVSTDVAQELLDLKWRVVGGVGNTTRVIAGQEFHIPPHHSVSIFRDFVVEKNAKTIIHKFGKLVLINMNEGEFGYLKDGEVEEFGQLSFFNIPAPE